MKKAYIDSSLLCWPYNKEMEPELEENTVVKKGFSWEIPGLRTEINYLMRKEKWKRQKVFKGKNKIFQQGRVQLE